MRRIRQRHLEFNRFCYPWTLTFKEHAPWALTFNTVRVLADFTKGRNVISRPVYDKIFRYIRLEGKTFPRDY